MLRTSDVTEVAMIRYTASSLENMIYLLAWSRGRERWDGCWQRVEELIDYTIITLQKQPNEEPIDLIRASGFCR
jgi:hypothetical protein